MTTPPPPTADAGPARDRVPRTADGTLLSECPVKGGFRMRGIAMTRIETFTDAAFAFAVTLLVVSIDVIPTSYADLVTAMQGVPAFAMSFAIVFMFWHAHWSWSRRYGLEDGPTILLSGALVFVMLCYVYPLKYLFTMMLGHFTPLPAMTAGITAQQLYDIFAIYGAGFIALCLIVVLLNLHAWRRRKTLFLDAVERFDTLGEITAWSIAAGVGLVSVLIALFTPPNRFAPPGWVYMTMPVVMTVYGVVVGRRRKRVPREIAGGDSDP